MSENVLEVKGLTKQFGNFTAVNDVSFAIAKGEIFGLLGANGAGKTTTINMLLDVTEPTSGRVTIFGKNLHTHREAALQEMNFASPYVFLPYRLTVFENLMIIASLYGVPRAKQRIAEVAELFGVAAFLKKPTGMLSSGQQTRVGLAKALLNRPKLLLLDEPTASLDPDMARKAQEALRQAQREYGTAILYTSHNMMEVERMCERMAFMDRGKILSVGTPLEVTRHLLAEERDLPALEEVFLKVANQSHEVA